MTTATVLVIRLPVCPDAALSPNSRKHWAARLRPKAQARQMAYLAAREACWEDAWPAFDGPVTVRITIGWAKGRKSVDGDNALAMCKSYVDGLNGIVWADDKLCRFEPVEQERDKDGVGYIVLEIES
jgi:hypothetical protein